MRGYENFKEKFYEYYHPSFNIFLKYDIHNSYINFVNMLLGTPAVSATPSAFQFFLDHGSVAKEFIFTFTCFCSYVHNWIRKIQTQNTGEWVTPEKILHVNIKNHDQRIRFYITVTTYQFKE